MDEVDFTILAATSVFTDLSEKCPPAEACRDAIDRTARATIRMANSTGGFGQVLPPKQSGSRGNTDQRDWANKSDTGSNKSQRQSRAPQRLSQQYDLPGITDAYANVSSGSQLPPIQSAPSGPYRMNSLPNIKPDQDGFSMMRNVPGQPHSNASAPDPAGTPENSAIDPSLLPSPGAVRTPPAGRPSVMGSPVVNATGSAGGLGRGTMPPVTSAAQSMAAFLAQSQAPSQQAIAASPFSPGAVNFTDLQGMDFLQQVNGGNNGLNNGVEEPTMDLNFGLGWEGMHHDFSDGQQYDLFDGFFFGGQQGGGSGGVGPNGVL